MSTNSGYEEEEAKSIKFSQLIGHAPEFKPGPNASWESFVVQLNFFFEANAITDPTRKRAILISSVGQSTVSTISSLISPKHITDLTYDQLIEFLNSHLSPTPNEIVQCFNFYRRNQEDGESISDFLVNLRHMSQFCNFVDLEKQLMMRLIGGVSDKRLQLKLLHETQLTLDQATQIALAWESANGNVADIRASTHVLTPHEATELAADKNRHKIMDESSIHWSN